ncbi:ABC transporter permease subunit [Psychromonas sp. PT13]|uniref:ABC transporter permease subunit n=1 Tax=Psychromonas sp. PT13 TaxID=3439547 RepID=UPI003EBC0BD2
MLNYLLRRLNLLLITGFILTVFTFVITNWSTYEYSSTSPSVIDYLHYMWSLIQGDWGISTVDQQPILMKGWLAFYSTLQLCLIAFLVAMVIGVPLGIIAALNRKRFIDYLAMFIILVSLALPSFWLGLIAIMSLNSFGIDFPVHPSANMDLSSTFLLFNTLFNNNTYTEQLFLERLVRILLSASVLSFFLLSEVARITRHSITSILKSNYIKAAYTKGLNSRQIVLNHVLKNALPSIILQIKIQLSTMISFAMVIEIVFTIPGAGSWVMQSVNAGDYLALPTAIILIALFISLISILVDILLMLISPVKRKSLYVG